MRRPDFVVGTNCFYLFFKHENSSVIDIFFTFTVISFQLNTIANYDASIIPYLNAELDTAFERIECMDAFKRL